MKAEKRKAEIDTNDSVKKLRTDFNNANAVILKRMENENELKEKIELLCDRLFANNVIEDYEYQFEKK